MSHTPGCPFREDGTPVVFVHPDDVGDLPAFKAQAALLGASVEVSRAVPPGRQFVAPKGLMRPVGDL